jgi:hypothetical protein
MNAAERDRVLADKPEPARRILHDKLAEYDAMTPAQRETRLRATELQYYLRPLLSLSLEERSRRLTQIPEAFRSLATEHLAQWDALDAVTREELLTNAWAIRHFVRLENTSPAETNVAQQQLPPQQRNQFEAELARWKALPAQTRIHLSRAFHQFFELPSAKQQRALETLPDSERSQIEATLQAFAELRPAQRQACLDSFRKLAGLTAEQRAHFLQSVELWKNMSPHHRALWRRVVVQLPPLPPLHGSRTDPPMPPAQASPPPLPNRAPASPP